MGMFILSGRDLVEIIVSLSLHELLGIHAAHDPKSNTNLAIRNQAGDGLLRCLWPSRIG